MAIGHDDFLADFNFSSQKMRFVRRRRVVTSFKYLESGKVDAFKKSDGKVPLFTAILTQSKNSLLFTASLVSVGGFQEAHPPQTWLDQPADTSFLKGQQVHLF